MGSPDTPAGTTRTTSTTTIVPPTRTTRRGRRPPRHPRRRPDVGLELQPGRAAAGGFPFFIWYQFLWVFLCSGLTYAAYRLVLVARPHRPMDSLREPGDADRPDGPEVTGPTGGHA